MCRCSLLSDPLQMTVILGSGKVTCQTEPNDQHMGSDGNNDEDWQYNPMFHYLPIAPVGLQTRYDGFVQAIARNLFDPNFEEEQQDLINQLQDPARILRCRV